MLIEALRPFLRGLSEGLYGQANIILKPEETFEWKTEKKGWLMSAIGSCNSPDAVIIHNFWGQEIRYPLRGILPISGTLPNNEFNWISTYDTTNNVYTALYAPRPYKYFKEGSRIAIYNPTSNPITIYMVGFHYIEIMDEKALLESLRQIFMVK